MAEERTYTKASAWGLDTERGEAWQERALCAQVDSEIFFPEPGDSAGAARSAKKICARCEVRKPCLQWALERDERYGIYGGFSERERQRIRRGELAPVVVLPIPEIPRSRERYKVRRHCVSCGMGLHGRGRHRYCSLECKRKARGQPNKLCIDCAVCGEEFRGYHRARYCSDDCRDTARRATWRHQKQKHRESA
jgi:WhiB family redox-sensing transcriptional regulator